MPCAGLDVSGYDGDLADFQLGDFKVSFASSKKTFDGYLENKPKNLSEDWTIGWSSWGVWDSVLEARAAGQSKRALLLGWRSPLYKVAPTPAPLLAWPHQ